MDTWTIWIVLVLTVLFGVPISGVLLVELVRLCRRGPTYIALQDAPANQTDVSLQIADKHGQGFMVFLTTTDAIKRGQKIWLHRKGVLIPLYLETQQDKML